MTLIPHDNWSVTPVQGKRYKVGPYCEVPDCRRLADHAHHIWRRSFIGGDYAWVKIPMNANQSIIVGNLCGLCWRHHNDVTGGVGGHKAWIRWDTEDMEYQWWVKTVVWENRGPIKTQFGDKEKEEPERCEKCGRKNPDQSVFPPGEKRQRKTWSIRVPDDTEDGADVLDTLVTGCAEALKRDGHTHYRYFTVVEALAFLLQHKDMV